MRGRKLVILGILIIFMFTGCRNNENYSYTDKIAKSYQIISDSYLQDLHSQKNKKSNNILSEVEVTTEDNIRTLERDTSAVGGQSTENETYALYSAHISEENETSTNEYVWTERKVNIFFPQIYYSNEFTGYDAETEKQINQILFMEATQEDNCSLISRDIRGMVEYNMDYIITKADKNIFSIKYWGHLYSVDHGHNICSGITIDIETGERVLLSEVIVLDDTLISKLENGEITYTNQAEYEKDRIIEIVQEFLDDYEENLIDAYNCFFVEENAISIIVPVYQGNANYIILSVPISNGEE